MDAASHLARLGARARPAGGEGVAEAQRYCADVLGQYGFDITKQVFKYSKLSGAWGAPIVGIVVPSVAMLLGMSYDTTPRWWAAAAIVIVLTTIVLSYVARGAPGFPLLRAAGTNLVATRGGANPTVWLVAHLDSKWQPVPMIVRVAGVITMLVGVAIMLFAMFVFPPAFQIVWKIVWLGAIPLLLSVVGSRNHGTLDNASGAAVVLEAASRLPASTPVGILFTDAEELALAGSRAWARSLPPAIALNCDSVDDDGPLVAMYTGPRPSRVVSAVEWAASHAGERLRVTRLVPGILTDSVALAGRGWATVTLSRGTIRTLWRIHTSRDTLATMQGTRLEGAVQTMVNAATDLVRNDVG